MAFTPSVTKLILGREPTSGLHDGLRSIPTYINKYSLTANSAASITVPSGASKVILSADVNVYVNCNGTAASSATTDGSGSELNPEGYVFDSDTQPSTISVISTSNGNITASFYK